MYFSVVRFVLFVYFFFQAEDGIRDGRVTGVQTCALPIFGRAARRVPTGEALLQRDDQRIAGRGEAEDREHDEAREGQRAPGTRKARRQQQQAEDADRNNKIGRDGEETEDLGEGE